MLGCLVAWDIWQLEEYYAYAVSDCLLVFWRESLHFRSHSWFQQQPDTLGSSQTFLLVCLCNNSVMTRVKKGLRDRGSYGPGMPVQVCADRSDRLSGVYPEWEEKKRQKIELNTKCCILCCLPALLSVYTLQVFQSTLKFPTVFSETTLTFRLLFTDVARQPRLWVVLEYCRLHSSFNFHLGNIIQD